MTGQVLVNNPAANGSTSMNPFQRVRALLVSLALGALGACLDFTGGPPGPNVLLAAGAVVLGLRLVLGPLTSTGRLILAAGLVPALGLLLWDALPLRTFNLLALLGCLGLFLLFGGQPGDGVQSGESEGTVDSDGSGKGDGAGQGDSGGDRPWTLGGATFVHGVAGLVVAACYGLVGGPLLWSATARQINGRQSARRWLPIAGATVRGLLMAIPLLLLFIMLFTSADPVFRRLLQSVFNWAGWFPPVGNWLVRFVFGAWLAAGVLYTALRNPVPALVSPLKVPTPALQGLEPGVALAALNTLFITFVVMQLRYLLGGVQWLEAAGSSYAEYARRGFFEMVMAAALVIPILRTAHGLMPRGVQGAAHRLFRWMAWLMLALTGLMVVSAGHRLALYVQAYGWTTARLYAGVIMAGLTLILLLVFFTTVGRGDRGFAAGVLAVAFLLLIVLNVINPDAVVVGSHARRIQAGEEADLAYMARIGARSADGVPGLLPVLASLPVELRGRAARTLLERWGDDKAAGFRHWNFSRARARRLVGEQVEQLRKWEEEGERELRRILEEARERDRDREWYRDSWNPPARVPAPATPGDALGPGPG